MKYLLKNSFKYFKPYIGIHIFAIFLGLMRVIISLVIPQILSLMVDRVIAPALGEAPAQNSSIFNFLLNGTDPSDYSGIMLILSLTFLFFIFLYFICFYAKWNITHYFATKSEQVMKKEVFAKISAATPEIIKKYPSGELITMANQDPSDVTEFYRHSVQFTLDSVFFIAASTYFLARINLFFILFSLMIVAIALLITIRYIISAGKLHDERWEKNTKLNTAVQESIYGIRTIKAYAKEDYQSGKLDHENSAYKNFSIKFARWSAKYDFLYTAMEAVLYISCLIFSIYLAVNLRMTSGEFTSFLAYIVSIGWNVAFIAFVTSDMQRSAVSAKRMFGFLYTPDNELMSYGDKTISAKPDIKIKNISFADGEKQILSDISLEIPYGKKIGIMGQTGSGKSMLLKALQSLNKIDSGEILFDGVNIKEYAKDEITGAFGYAMQDTFLFSNTIKANIAYYNPYAEEEKLLKCAGIAEVSGFVSAFKDGYDSLIGEKGFGLSGGQRQRVTIARALLKDAPCLILDDCTSALDLDTEAKIFKKIKENYPEKTLIIATHRTNAIMDCDEIIYMENGVIIERGTHNELTALGGKYAEIYHYQKGDIINE